MRTLDHINVKYFKYACDEIGKETPVDIAAKCIICGDSHKDKRQKRLHLYTKSNYDGDAIKCFNCEWTGNMYSFLREVDSSLFEQYKKETREKSFDILKSKRNKRQEFKDASIQIGSYERKSKIEPGEKKGPGTERSNQGRTDSGSQEVENEENNRNGHDGVCGIQESPGNDENDMCNGKTESKRRRDYSFANISGGNSFIAEDKGGVGVSNPESIETDANEQLIKDLGIIPDEVFGLPNEFIPASESDDATRYLQGRNLDPSLYFYSTDWLNFNGKNMPLKNCIIIPLWVLQDDNVLYGFQARSIESKFFYTYIPEENSGFKVWNWFGIDKTKPTFIFESAFDAESSGLPLDRVCAALGADLNDERIAELSQPIFCFDNQRVDETSRRKTVQLLKKGYKCFVWDKTINCKDTNDAIRSEYTKNEMAKYILSHLETGMTGIIKAKLKM